MTAVTASPPAPAISAPVRTTRRQDLITVLLALWLMIGLFVDGWAHNNLGGIETFLTPWHALFYSGFTATALWILWLVARNRSAGLEWRDAVPAGYGAAVAGVVVFGVGGVGDFIWHTIFGIEVSLDALLSPTHLVLFTGMMLIFAGPLRASWADPEEPRGLGSFLAPALATTLATALIAFFFMYASGLDSIFPTLPYIPTTDSGAEGAIFGVIFTLWSTLILVGPLVLLLRRWHTPFGTFTMMYTVVGVLMAALMGFQTPLDTVPPLVAGLVADLLIHALGAGPDKPRSVRIVAALVPVVLWTVRYAGIAALMRMAWPPELWSGTIFFSALLGLGLSFLAFPPSSPRVAVQ